MKQNLIDSLSTYIAKSIRKNDPNASSEAILKYSLTLILNTFFSFLIILTFCFLSDHFKQGLTVLFFFCLLRFISGGVHLTSSVACTVVSSVLLILLAHLELDYYIFGRVLDLISLLILLIWSPMGIENVTRIDIKYFPLLKLLSVMLCATNFYFQNSLLSGAFFAQALTLLPIIYKIVLLLERRESE
jgi:accessory gene regulator B